MSLEQKKKNRFLFLEKLYSESNGDTGAMFNMWEVGKELNFEREATRQIVDYLIGENLIEAIALGGGISLTHWGVKEVEQAIEYPNRATEHFLPINIINVETMTNSTIQQATSNSTITNHFDSNKLNQLNDLIKSLKDISEKISLTNDLSEELNSEIQTLTIQKDSPKPKPTIITESLKSVRTILESVAGNALTPVIVEQITKFLS
ncbi:MAG: hypothetical protein JSS64_13525 [Bacteroidetes bacterium]|nr:hypothetical protein [Bacteroidota bacterium]